MPFALQRLIVGPANAARSLLFTLVVTLLFALAAVADEGWVIERFNIRLDIQRDGSIAAHEALDVDFGGLSRHGIFRDLFYLFSYDATHNREYDIRLMDVTAADGRRHQVQTTTEGAIRRFRIGDPDRTASGKETYRIAYRIGGALNGFPDHDELYWNASGTWPVRVQAVAVVVTAPGGSIGRVECFQGPEGSREPCSARFTPDEATFTATRPLAEGEQMTIVAGLRKGAVAEPRPLLVLRPRDITNSFDRTPGLLAATSGRLPGDLRRPRDALVAAGSRPHVRLPTLLVPGCAGGTGPAVRIGSHRRRIRAARPHAAGPDGAAHR